MIEVGSPVKNVSFPLVEPMQGEWSMGKSNEDELRDILNSTAGEIARMYDNPRSWNSWMVYLLEHLEEQANQRNPAYMETFKEMLLALQDELRNRLKTGGW
jgi:hypothetical protein